VTIKIAVQDGPARPDDADGVIIDLARQLGMISGLATRLVTRDLGMQLLAQVTGVDALLLDTAPGEQADQVLRG
jgi:hypothetical protein